LRTTIIRLQFLDSLGAVRALLCVEKFYSFLVPISLIWSQVANLDTLSCQFMGACGRSVYFHPQKFCLLWDFVQ